MAKAERSVLEENKELVRQYLEGIYRGNYDILDEVITPEFYADRPPDPAGQTPGSTTRPASVPSTGRSPTSGSASTP